MNKEKKYDIVGKRPDSVGLFWSEPKEIKVKAERITRTPPEPTWLADDYLPHLDKAQNWNPDVFTPDELWQAARQGERLVFDIEVVLQNHFLVMFKSLDSGKLIWFERGIGVDFHIPTLQYIVDNFCLISFNGNMYDIPILALALAGKTWDDFREAGRMLIEDRCRPWEVMRKYGLRNITPDHIDLIAVAPLSGSLKIYGGRCHTKQMQDLPFPVGAVSSVERELVVRWYCANDLQNTEDIYRKLEKSIQTREKLNLQYGIDLRSKSDAQIAEAVIRSEYKKLTGLKAEKPDIPAFTSYRFEPPSFLQFSSPLMQWVIGRVSSMDFILGENGKLALPKELKELKFEIGGTAYNMGLGGLHSMDKTMAVFADSEHDLLDADVTSYYPFAILNSGYFPLHLGRQVIQIFKTLVDMRLHAKRTGNKRLANELKITINGFFGKLSDRWSVLYSPKSMMQVTLTGQFSLLMLIERLELVGIPIVSANTDGIVIRCPKAKKDLCSEVIAQWEIDSGFDMEYAHYNALLSRDVNNYMAVTTEGEVKGKGVYGYGVSCFHKNPVNFICIDAMHEFLKSGKHFADTIRECTDVRKFLEVRNVTGGAVYDGEFLGKAVRWYKSNSTESEIIYAKSGNKVAGSDNSRPMMLLSENLPQDLDYQFYINETALMLLETGYPVSLAEDGLTESQFKRLKKLN